MVALGVMISHTQVAYVWTEVVVLESIPRSWKDNDRGLCVVYFFFPVPSYLCPRLSCETTPNCSDDILLCALICFPDGDGQCFA